MLDDTPSVTDSEDVDIDNENDCDESSGMSGDATGLAPEITHQSQENKTTISTTERKCRKCGKSWKGHSFPRGKACQQAPIDKEELNKQIKLRNDKRKRQRNPKTEECKAKDRERKQTEESKEKAKERTQTEEFKAKDSERKRTEKLKLKNKMYKAAWTNPKFGSGFQYELK